MKSLLKFSKGEGYDYLFDWHDGSGKTTVGNLLAIKLGMFI